MIRRVTTYALIHGAWHDGWCWAPLVAELERRGHRAVAPDLPCDDAAATFADYAAVVAAALGDAGDDVVLVAHSLGGQTAPLVPARRAVRAIVYLCAVVAEPGRTLVAQTRDDPGPFVPGYERGLEIADEHGSRVWADEALAIAAMYADVPAPLARAALAHLRPQAVTPYRVPCPLDALPDVPVASIVCADDEIVSPEWSRRTAAERLGVTPVQLPGGHTPSLARPAALADAVVVGV